jgi:hypothetical protein
VGYALCLPVVITSYRNFTVFVGLKCMFCIWFVRIKYIAVELVVTFSRLVLIQVFFFLLIKMDKRGKCYFEHKQLMHLNDLILKFPYHYKFPLSFHPMVLGTNSLPSFLDSHASSTSPTHLYTPSLK